MPSDDFRDMRGEIIDAIAQGMKAGFTALASASRFPAPEPQSVTVRTQKVTHPFAIVGLAVTFIVPLCGWCFSLNSRVAVLESKQSTLETASAEIAALKQEVSDFRGEFREWKRDNRSQSSNGSSR